MEDIVVFLDLKVSISNNSFFFPTVVTFEEKPQLKKQFYEDLNNYTIHTFSNILLLFRFVSILMHLSLSTQTER